MMQHHLILCIAHNLMDSAARKMCTTAAGAAKWMEEESGGKGWQMIEGWCRLEGVNLLREDDTIE